jgi:hypothetical protein
MDEPRSLRDATRPQLTGADRERRIAEIAHAQWTMITRTQLTELGLSSRAVSHRVASGRLHRRHRGVFSVGHDIAPWQGHVMAAVLACGEGAVASHHAAARLHGLIERGLRLHVTVPGRRAARLPGILTHTTARLEPWQLTSEQRVPCTSWARTVVDVTGAEGRRAAERMIDRAEQLRIFDLRELRRELDHGRGRSGTSDVRAVIGAVTSTLTRNELEERLLAVCDDAGLPRPEVNLEIALHDGGPHVVADFAWPELGLIVETDGWASHGTRLAFASDRRRDRRLALAAWRVLRFTWHELEHEPQRVAHELARATALAS